MSTPTRAIILAVLVLAITSTIAFRRGESPSAPATAAPSPSASAAAALPRLVELGAEGCIPCRAMVPVLDALRRDFAGRLQVDFIDVLKYPDQAAPFNIYAMPTQVFLDGSGRELYRHLGFFSKEDILATWRKLGIRLDASGKE